VSLGDPAGVLVTTDAYPPDCGGSGWSTHALVTGLRQRGVPVEVLKIDAHGTGAAQELDFEGVPLRTLPLGGHRTLARHLMAHDYSCAPVRQFVADYLRARPDLRLVHGQHLHSGQGAALAARDAGRAAVVTLRDYWPVRLDGIAWPEEGDDADAQRRLVRRALVHSFGVPAPAAALLARRGRRRLQTRQRALLACQRVICVSDAVRRRIVGAVDRPLDVIPNMIDPERSAAAATRGQLPAGVTAPYLLVAGKLNAAKGFDRVVSDLAAARCPWPLVVAGSGPLADAMRRDAARTGLAVISDLGWADGDTMLRLARDATAVLVPSAWEEPLARVILEAMSVGTPVIARATGGSPEAISAGRDGFLYSTIEELGAALEALADAGTAATIGAAALATCARTYAPEVVLAQVMECYDRALGATSHA
jgi:glycosyltransferase involved in cell wall biosynthesis